MLRAARFLHGYFSHPPKGVVAEEITISMDRERVPCTLYRPHRPGTHPGWVVLHGITVPGRDHPSLRRFASALAASGGVVLVPEVASWRELEVDPAAADRVIVAAAEQLAELPGVDPGGVGLVGFSFGATQAIATACRPEVDGVIRAVLGFGGYCDPIATFVYAFTGEYEWASRRHYLEPDPYGRWIVTANYLTAIPEFAGYSAVAHGARRLAADAGQRGNFAGDPIYDAMKSEIRAALSAGERAVWDLIAPPSGVRPPADEARDLGRRVAAAAVARHPGLDPRPALAALTHPVVLAHGYHDQLVPYTESLRLHRELPSRIDPHVTISRLFAHSKEAPRLRLREYPFEVLRYVRLLDRALNA